MQKTKTNPMIELVFKANRPELSDSSLKQYLSTLRTLNDKKPIFLEGL